MTISESIARIIERRNAKVPALMEKRDHIHEILSIISDINRIKLQMLENSEEFKIGPDVRESIQVLSTADFENAMHQLIKAYDDTINRFSRSEINIAVVGSARQGKSQLLQSISNLDNSVIPAFANNDCTGASSVIKNVPGATLKADISFRTEIEMVKAVQTYLDNIFGEKTYSLGCFEDIRRLSVSELEKHIDKGSAKTTKFDHLKKYIDHFDEWKDLVRKGSITITDPDEIQKYVAQHNGKNESSPDRKNYYYYLAVKEAVIYCEFNNPDAGSIVLRDTIGLGDTSLGISEKMLETISVHSDAAIIVRRPETGTGKFDETDTKLYEELNNAFAKRNIGKWLFWLLNHTTKDSMYGDNKDRCEAFKAKLSELKFNIAQSYVVNAADKDAVNNQFLPNLLEILIDNIDAIDSGILTGIQELAEKAYGEFKDIQKMINNIIIQGAGDVVDTTDFLDDRWDELYESGLMKLLLEYKKDLSDKKDMECVAFKNKVIEILDNSINLIPSENELLSQLQKGGKNRGIDVFTMRLDKLRTEFTKEFIGIDEEIFDEQVTEFKQRIVEIFASDEGGRLDHLMAASDFDTPDEWLHVFAEKYFVKTRYENFKVAFDMLSEFSLTVRGFLMHRIRDRIDRLNPTGYAEQELSSEDEAKKLRLTLKRKLKDVKEELLKKFEDELFREPNRVFYAIISEFYDRINFSYQASMKDAEKTWEKFYDEHLIEIFGSELKDNLRFRDLYNGWTELSDSLSKFSRQDFIANN